MAAGGSSVGNYTFKLANVKNTSGESLVQSKDNFSVVVLVIDVNNSTVINAIKTKVSNPALVGITNPVNAFSARITQYYDLSGRAISAPQRCLNLRRVTYSDGTTRVVKELKK